MQVLTEQAVYGVSAGIGVALPVLLFTTQNWKLGLMATMTILMSTVCVIGMIPVAGWKLGVSFTDLLLFKEQCPPPKITVTLKTVTQCP